MGEDELRRLATMRALQQGSVAIMSVALVSALAITPFITYSAMKSDAFGTAGLDAVWVQATMLVAKNSTPAGIALGKYVTKKDIEDFVATTLPKAGSTSDNYYDVAANARIFSIKIGAFSENRNLVNFNATFSYSEIVSGVAQTVTDDYSFAINDVEVSDSTATIYENSAGKPADGIEFKCDIGSCIGHFCLSHLHSNECGGALAGIEFVLVPDMTARQDMVAALQCLRQIVGSS